MRALLAVFVAGCAGAAEHDDGKSGNLTQVQDCCGSALGGTCADGTLGTPCCGYGGCNIFCCGCEGGCRAAPPAPPPAPPPTPSASTTPLNQWPMIMAHDAVTSYYSEKSCQGLLTPESNYVMTQSPGTWTQQLHCGARAFDLRPLSKDGQLIAHHGAYAVNVKVSDLLIELKAWQAKNPNELVIVYGSDCDGDNCWEMFYDALRAAAIPLLECSQISQLTLGSAMKIGSVLALDGCVETNYDPSIMCYKERGEKAKERMQAQLGRNLSVAETRTLIDSCYGSNSQQFFDVLWNNVATLSDGRGKDESNLWMVQAHWQYDASSTAQGIALGSCILKEESAAAVNSKLAEKLVAGEFPHVNLLEVDDVCDGDGSGLRILSALRSRFKMDIDLSGLHNVVV